MDDQATAAKIVADFVQVDYSDTNGLAGYAARTPLRDCAAKALDDKADIVDAIVAALEAARRSVTDAAKGGIIDCTGDVPVVRKVLGTFVLTADGCVWAHGAKVYWRDDPHEESIENINDDIAFFEDHGTDATGEVCGMWEKVGECYSTPEAARAAMEGGKA